METVRHATIVIGGIGNFKAMQGIVAGLTKKQSIDYTLVGCFPLQTGSPPFGHETFLRLNPHSDLRHIPQPQPEGSEVLMAAMTDEPLRLHATLKQAAKQQKKIADCYRQKYPDAFVHMTTVVIGNLVIGPEKEKKWKKLLERFSGLNKSFIALHYNEKGAYAEQVSLESYLTFARVAEELGGVCTVINPNRPKIMADVLHVGRHIIQNRWPSPEGKGHLKKMETKIGKEFYVSCRNRFLQETPAP